MRIGVCSWSLRPASVEDLIRALRQVEIPAVQLALDPLRTGAWPPEDTARRLRDAGITILSGMMAMHGEDYSSLETIQRTGGVRPDEHWETNLAAATDNARIARTLGVELVTFHAGFIPHEPSDPERPILTERLRALVDVFANHGVRVAFETGQETADTLVTALDELDRPSAGVNFDPANLILYGMGDPVEALRKLSSRVLQIHAKDAVATTRRGTWGTEVPVGSGDVNWQAFFATLAEARLDCDLVIEREAGGDRRQDILTAREQVERHLM